MPAILYRQLKPIAFVFRFAVCQPYFGHSSFGYSDEFPLRGAMCNVRVAALYSLIASCALCAGPGCFTTA
jgi:hypothetical protein